MGESRTERGRVRETRPCEDVRGDSGTPGGWGEGSGFGVRRLQSAVKRGDVPDRLPALMRGTDGQFLFDWGGF